MAIKKSVFILAAVIILGASNFVKVGEAEV
jgi:hypothetical protein